MTDLYLQYYVVKARNKHPHYCERCRIEQYDEYINTGELKLVVWYDHEVVWKGML